MFSHELFIMQIIVQTKWTIEPNRVHVSTRVSHSILWNLNPYLLSYDLLFVIYFSIWLRWSKCSCKIHEAICIISLRWCSIKHFKYPLVLSGICSWRGKEQLVWIYGQRQKFIYLISFQSWFTCILRTVFYFQFYLYVDHDFTMYMYIS